MAKQEGRYSEVELAVIKATFSNEDLLKAIQKSFLQLPLDVSDLSTLQVNLKGRSPVHKILRKMILPQLTDDVPYKQFFDLTLALDFKNKAYEEIVLNIRSNKVAIAYFDQQLKALEDGKYQVAKPRLSFKKLTEIKNDLDKDIYINVMARNNIVGTIAGRLDNLYHLATRIEETKEQREERQRKDSAK